MWNYGKSPSSGLYPEIGRRAKQGSRVSSLVSLRHGSDAWSAVVIEVKERPDQLGTGSK
jgi:hypothetical protein